VEIAHIPTTKNNCVSVVISVIGTMLSDKIEQMKEIGISESETNIQLLLSKFSFNVENAICHYFEHGMSNLPMANPFAANKDRYLC
jgi:hypothetical protein